MLKAFAFGAAFVAASAAFSDRAAAQTGAMRIIHGVQADASTDMIARLLAEKMRVTLGETIMVEPRPGAGQRIAMAELQKNAPDSTARGAGAFSRFMET